MSLVISREDLVKISAIDGVGAKTYAGCINLLDVDFERVEDGANGYHYIFTGDPAKLDQWKDLLTKAREIKTEPQANSDQQSFLLLTDKDYPLKLSSIADPPKRLYYQGDLSLLQRSGLAIVGTRRATSFGRREVERLVAFCAYQRLITISGLARGVDTAAHYYSIKYGVPTIAVLPGSIANPYPRENRDLASKIVAAGGLLLSENLSPLKNADGKVAKYTFLSRNRVIAALASATCVIEAPLLSGSLNTAKFASGYGRPVFVSVAQPEFRNVQGNFRLLDSGVAKVLTGSYRQLEEELGLGINSVSGYNRHLYDQETVKGLDQTQKSILTAIRNGGNTMERIAGLLQNRDRSTLAHELAKLHLSGLISRDKHGQFITNL